MKKVALLLLICIFIPAQSLLAESFNVGQSRIDYTAPAGHFSANDGPYQDFLNIMRDSMKNVVNVFAMYVTAEMDEEFRRQPEQGLHSYLILLSGKDVEKRLVDVDGFKLFRDSLREQQGEIEAASLGSRLDDILDADVSSGPGVVRAVGVFGESDSSIYSLTIVSRYFDTGTSRILLHQAMVAGYFLVQGKMVGVNQYRPISSSLDAERFMGEAVKIVESMQFSYGGAALGSVTQEEAPAPGSGTAAKSGGLDPGMLRALGMAALGAVIGGIIIVLRKKKQG